MDAEKRIKELTEELQKASDMLNELKQKEQLIVQRILELRGQIKERELDKK